MIDRRSLETRKRKGLQQMRRWGLEISSENKKCPGYIGRAGTTPVPCSCYMCGNPRRKFKGKNSLTLQELKALEAERIQNED